jgi:hypothetical protein
LAITQTRPCVITSKAATSVTTGFFAGKVPPAEADKRSAGYSAREKAIPPGKAIQTGIIVSHPEPAF